MKFYKDIVEAHPNSQIYDKCWDGYEKVPGKKRGEPGSCREKSVKEDAEPMDRERQLVKKLGQLGSMIVQNPKLWDKYSEAIDNDNVDWIIALIQDRTGANQDEVMHLSELFGEIGGGLGRLVDFAWAVKEGRWEEDFMKPYIEYKKQGMAESEGKLNENASKLLSAEDRNGVITVVVQAPDGTKRSLADENPRYINRWLMKYGLTLPKSIMSKFIENDSNQSTRSFKHQERAWDEASVMYKFDTADQRLKQKSIVHARMTQARSEGWRDSHEQAMRDHGYFPSKFKRGEYVRKGADGNWIKVYPYADKTVKEFAPNSSGDGGDDGFSEETLKRFAAQWYNGDEDPGVEKTLAAAGWEIGQDEGYDDEPGVFVVQAGDINGNSFISWPANELKQSVAEGDLSEFAPSAGNDDNGEDPYKYPKPESYRRSIDFFGRFEADHFDREDFDDATGVFKGYWGKTQIAYFKFDNPAKTGSDDPGMGWYYEPQSDTGSDDISDKPAAFDNSEQRKQQELSMIDAFLKSGQQAKPGSQIYGLMKKHGITEGSGFGAYYYEQLAQQVFDQDKNLDATGQANQVMDAGYAIARRELGNQQAHRIFAYDEDFASDFVSAYAYLQQNKQVKEQNMPDNSLGYKNTLAVMKAADSSQEATINLGGEPVTLDYPEARFIAGKYKAFLRAGRQEEFFGYMANPQQFDSMMKQLRGLHDKQKAFKGSVPGERGVPGETQTPWIREGVDNDSPVAGAITHRIMIQRHDLLSKYGPAKVLAAIDDVADFVGDVEEIGSSDVSAWVKQVEQALAGMGESELDEGWKEKLGAAALAGTLAFGAAGNAMARVTPDGQGGYTGGKPVATQMAPAATQAAQPGAEMPGKNLQAVDNIDGNKSSGYTITQDGKSYDVKVVPKGSPTPRGAKMMKVSQAQLGERGIGNYVVYLLNNGTAYLYMGDVSEAAPGFAKAAGGLALGGIAAAGAPALVGILGPLVGIPFAAYAAYSAAKLGMKGVEKLWDMASEKLGSDDKVEQYATAQIAKLPPDQKQAAVATIKQLGESRKLVKENLRLVGKHGDGAKTAKVYKDHEWGEYRVKFYTDGKHEGEAADYHTDDRDDANDTAKSWTTKGEKIAESTYWCRQEKTRKLIPEGYKKTAQGYITKV